MATKRSSLRACQQTAKRPHHGADEDKQDKVQDKAKQAASSKAPAPTYSNGSLLARQKELIDRLLKEKKEKEKRALKRKLESDSE